MSKEVEDAVLVCVEVGDDCESDVQPVSQVIETSPRPRVKSRREEGMVLTQSTIVLDKCLLMVGLSGSVPVRPILL